MDHYGYADALHDAVQSLSTKEAQDMLFDCLLSDTQKGELLIRALCGKMLPSPRLPSFFPQTSIIT